MAWRYEIYIVAAAGLQLQHHLCDRFGFYLVSTIGLADVMVLAVLAAQITAGEEYCAGATGTTKGRFFAKMRTIAADSGQFSSAADAQFSSTPVNRALPGTNIAN